MSSGTSGRAPNTATCSTTRPAVNKPYLVCVSLEVCVSRITASWPPGYSGLVKLRGPFSAPVYQLHYYMVTAWLGFRKSTYDPNHSATEATFRYAWDGVPHVWDGCDQQSTCCRTDTCFNCQTRLSDIGNKNDATQQQDHPCCCARLGLSLANAGSVTWNNIRAPPSLYGPHATDPTPLLLPHLVVHLAKPQPCEGSLQWHG